MWVRLWMEYGRGHRNTEETYREFPDEWDKEEILKDETEHWAQNEKDGWSKERYDYGWERVPKPPKEWLEKRIESAKSSIVHWKVEIKKLENLRDQSEGGGEE